MKKVLFYTALSFHGVYALDFNEYEKQIFMNEEPSVLERGRLAIKKISEYIRADAFLPSLQKMDLYLHPHSRQLFDEINRFLARERYKIAQKTGSPNKEAFGRYRLYPPLSQWTRDNIEKTYIFTGQIGVNLAESELIRDFSEFIMTNINLGDESKEYLVNEFDPDTNQNFPTIKIRVQKDDLPLYDFKNIDAFKLSYQECGEKLKKQKDITDERDMSHLIYHRHYGAAQSFYAQALSYCKKQQPYRQGFEEILFNYFFKKTALVIYINNPITHSGSVDHHKRMNCPKIEYCGCIYMCFPIKENGDLYYDNTFFTNNSFFLENTDIPSELHWRYITIRHCTIDFIDQTQELLCMNWQRLFIIKPQKDEEMSNSFKKDVADFFYLHSLVMPYVRGSEAILKWLISCMVSLHDLEIEYPEDFSMRKPFFTTRLQFQKEFLKKVNIRKLQELEYAQKYSDPQASETCSQISSYFVAKPVIETSLNWWEHHPDKQTKVDITDQWYKIFKECKEKMKHISFYLAELVKDYDPRNLLSFLESDMEMSSLEKEKYIICRENFFDVLSVLVHGIDHIARQLDFSSDEEGLFNQYIRKELSVYGYCQYERYRELKYFVNDTDKITQSYLISAETDSTIAESELIREFTEFILKIINSGVENKEYKVNEFDPDTNQNFHSLTIRVHKDDLPLYDYSSVKDFKMSHREHGKKLEQNRNTMSQEEYLSQFFYHKHYQLAIYNYDKYLSLYKAQQPNQEVTFKDVLFNYYFKKTVLVTFCAHHDILPDGAFDAGGLTCTFFPINENGDLFYDNTNLAKDAFFLENISVNPALHFRSSWIKHSTVDFTVMSDENVCSYWNNLLIINPRKNQEAFTSFKKNLANLFYVHSLAMSYEQMNELITQKLLDIMAYFHGLQIVYPEDFSMRKPFFSTRLQFQKEFLKKVNIKAYEEPLNVILPEKQFHSIVSLNDFAG